MKITKQMKNRVLPFMLAASITVVSVFSGKFLSAPAEDIETAQDENYAEATEISVENGDISVSAKGTSIRDGYNLKVEELPSEKAAEYSNYLRDTYGEQYEVAAVYGIRMEDSDGGLVQPEEDLEMLLGSDKITQEVNGDKEIVLFQNINAEPQTGQGEDEQTEEQEESTNETAPDVNKQEDSNVYVIGEESSNKEARETTEDEEPEIHIIGENNPVATPSNAEETENESEEYVVQELQETQNTAPEIVSLETRIKENKVSFKTNKLTEFIIATRAAGETSGIQLGKNQSMYINKYLEQTGDDTRNGQDTYDIYLEHEFYDSSDRSKMTLEPAPVPSYVVLILDQSTTMRNRPVEELNNAMRNFFTKVMEINQERLDSARRGEYDGINAASMTDEELKAAMAGHLIYINGVTGYHHSVVPKSYNGSQVWNKAPLTQADVDSLAAAAFVVNDAGPAPGVEDLDGDIQSGTNTDAALEWAYDFIQANPHATSVQDKNGNTKTYRTDNVVLLTDGLANSSPGAASRDGLYFKPAAMERSIYQAQRIKDLGATVYSVYERDMDTKSIQPALEANDGKGDLDKLVLPGFMNIRAMYMGLISSDTPKGGSVGYNAGSGQLNVDNPAYAGNRASWYTINEHPDNQFGTYTFFGSDVGDIVEVMNNVAMQLDEDAKGKQLTGYASSSSYIRDVISDPFEIMDGMLNIKVYAVPRIPAELDDENIPVGIVTDKNDPDYGIVKNFRWGDREVATQDGEQTSEWEDITDIVKLRVENNTVIVSGWNYENNALRNFDRDIAAKEPVPDDALIYEPGDYGYKIVVVIPINAKITFGGNSIETNNSDISAFYPSVPGGVADKNDPLYRPPWEDNTEYNPEGNPFIEKYPNPKVDLNISYKIVSDNIEVYAPQTAELHNLVTDINSRIWYVDNFYEQVKQEKENAYNEYEKALEAAQEGDGDNEPLWADVLVKNGEYLEASKKLSELEAYIPDGINNAFVDIHYVLTDPDGEEVGTLDIPHGKAFVESENGEGNIDWEFKDGEDAIIKKSGVYKITCTITPVDTVKAPGGHVSTEADLEETREAIPYDSTEYSPTGSSASGTKHQETLTENPEAYLYQLKVITDDTRLERNQTIDFNIGTEPLDSTENVHFVGMEWVCTDGVTESNPENEPGTTGMLSVGGGVMASSQIPDAAIEEGLAADVDGTMVVKAEDGEYVPVSVILARYIGDLNKSKTTEEQIKQVQKYMSDSDNIWGEGISSIIWEHRCEPIGEDSCNQAEFKEAQEKYSTLETEDGKGKVQYLIHVMDNPIPNVIKETSTPQISKGADIKWNVDISNSNEETNSKHRSAVFSFVDILPYKGDERIDPNTGREGSEFSGELMYKTVKIDFKDAQKSAEAFKGQYVLYYTTDKAVRDANENQLLGLTEDGAIEWASVQGTLEGTVVSYPVPMEAEAIKADMELEWQEAVHVDMTANMREASDQQAGDYYHNEALILSGHGMKTSNTVATEVNYAYISGTIWEDADADGLMSAEETKWPKITVKLYQKYDPKNPGKPETTINGIQLVPVYDAAGDQYPAKETGDDGFFEFKDIQEGTYYIVAERIPDGYDITKKNAGTDEETELMDSKAEEEFTETADDLTNTTWIKEIVVGSEGKPGQNIGILPIKGSIKIHKTLDEIYFAVTKTDEEKEKSNVMFTFTLVNQETGRRYQQSVQINQNNLEKGAYAVFANLPYGTYALTEEATEMYTLESIVCDSEHASWDVDNKSLTFTVSSEQYDFEAEASNKLSEDPPGLERPGLSNAVRAHIPVKMEIKYAGENPISSPTLTRYDFQASDFDAENGGDIIITFDDESQISISEGTLNFDQVSLTPTYVTNRMNTTRGNMYTIKGFYSENGHTVSDSFQVGIDLKPVHKFNIKFDANGSSFDTSAKTNSVYFGYDDENKENYVIRGQYKDAANQGLNPLSGFEFSGWNTKEDGTGIQYSTTEALNAIGADNGIKNLTLYANWKTNVRFYAGTQAEGARMSGGITDAEKALNNKWDGSIKVNFGQTIGTNLQASKTYHIFMRWNTKADGSGIDIKDYGKITGPVTFYAVYYRYQYPYANRTYYMTLPMDGWWELTVRGAAGLQDADSPGITRAKGGTTVAEYYFTKGTQLQITPGGMGAINGSGGYNGGGRGSKTSSEFTYGVGGGMTDIRYATGSRAMIIVAGGGGGGWKTLGQTAPTAYQLGNRAGYDNWNYSYGAGQNASGNAGGGGGGWPSGKAGNPSLSAHANVINAGAGGKGYIAGGARSSSMVTGNWNEHGFAQVYWKGN